MASKLNYIRRLVKIAPVVMFSKSYCPYCKMAKGFLTELRQNYTEIELDKRKDTEELLRVLKSLTGSRTVPRIFINGKCIGGFSDLRDMHESGELDKFWNDLH